MTVRDVPLHGARALAAAPTRFDLVGLHWRGPGSVEFRTRSLAGRWSGWQRAAPEAEDLPDVGNAERGAARAGGSGIPTGPARRTGSRTGCTGGRAAACVLRPEPGGARPAATALDRGLAASARREAWGANEAIRRAAPTYAAGVQFAVVHHTAGSNSYTASQSAAIVRGIEVYHVKGNGWNDIGYNFLVDKYGQVFEGRFGGVDKQRDRGARRGVQHRLVRCRAARHVRHGCADRGGEDGAREPAGVAARRRARRSAVDADLGVGRQCAVPGRRPGLVCAPFRATGTRASRRARARLSTRSSARSPGRRRAGLPKLYAPRPWGARRPGALPGPAERATALDGHGQRRGGRRRRDRERREPGIDWTWDASASRGATPGRSRPGHRSSRDGDDRYRAGRAGGHVRDRDAANDHARRRRADDASQIAYTLSSAGDRHRDSSRSPTAGNSPTLFTQARPPGSRRSASRPPASPMAGTRSSSARDGRTTVTGGGVLVDRTVRSFAAAVGFSPNGDGGRTSSRSPSS